MSNSRLAELRNKHAEFVFERFNYELVDSELRIQFFFTLLPDIEFSPTLVFQGIKESQYLALNPEVIENWIFQIGMVECLSYWKGACPPVWRIRAGTLDKNQREFWKKLLQNGLSEFFFVNEINGWEDDFVEVIAEETTRPVTIDEQQHHDHCLVPVGGGKDSVVTLELLKEMGQEETPLTVNQNDQIRQLLQIAQIGESRKVVRTLDPKLLELNAQGYLNGHTPFSAMLSFVSTFAAYLFDYRFVVLSNEFSANEGNTHFWGKSVNHQYSKSLEYETDFRNYVHEYLSTTIYYFSFLRPLHELQIAGLFSKYPQYFFSFLSCNRGQKTGKWCGECPKCLFVYVMLSAFLESAEVEKIWGQNLFAKESLRPILDELTGMAECKSFECVGTREETLVALFLILQKSGEGELPVLLKYSRDVILPQQEKIGGHDGEKIRDTASHFLTDFQRLHYLPKEFAEFLNQKIQNVP